MSLPCMLGPASPDSNFARSAFKLLTWRFPSWFSEFMVMNVESRKQEQLQGRLCSFLSFRTFLGEGCLDTGLRGVESTKGVTSKVKIARTEVKRSVPATQLSNGTRRVDKVDMAEWQRPSSESRLAMIGVLATTPGERGPSCWRRTIAEDQAVLLVLSVLGPKNAAYSVLKDTTMPFSTGGLGYDVCSFRSVPHNMKLHWTAASTFTFHPSLLLPLHILDTHLIPFNLPRYT